ncbi:MAG: molybdopterin dehydrogenase, FAD-binding [Myxococcales bacterium]|nr:molybdopterin dehydrogenase, FAD-binding [Myxococcales bacterium]
MREIRYLSVAAEGPAIRALQADTDATYLAGGTSLLDLMKLEVLNFAQLVDVNAIPLTKIEVSNDGARIGSMVRNSDLALHPEIAARYPLLSEALLSGASPQIRNMATVGGNLLQRTRCYYYRDPSTACNKRNPGSGCAAIDGYNRNHAILGTSDHCIATHASDMCVALAALDAVVHTQGPGGERHIPFAEFHRLPGDHPEIESVLQHGELITAVSLPPPTGLRQSRYLKIRDRASYAFALSAVAAALRIEGNLIRGARIALGGVGTKPWRAVEAEQALVGKPANRATFTLAAAETVRGARTRPHNAFKVELTRRAVVRALSTIRGAS